MKNCLSRSCVVLRTVFFSHSHPYNQVLKSVYIGHFAMSPFRDTAWYHSVPVDTISLLRECEIIQVKKLDVFVDEASVTHVL